MSPPDLTCDYLVVGAGASSLPFIDTLLTELPSAKIVLVDRYAVPGGHWVNDYGYVRLHQPSIMYGVSSKQLEGNWLKCMMKKRSLPWTYRSTKKEILQYFQEFVDEKVASGQLDFFPKCDYNFGQKVGPNNVHTFTSIDGENKYTVQVNEKLVNGVLGECKIPSQCPPQFPIANGIKMITPNQLYDEHQARIVAGGSASGTKYVVLGCGKTAMDSVVYLLREMKIPSDKISWVIPADVWMLAREGTGGPWTYARALLAADGDREKACMNLEKKGSFVRLDKDVVPARFRFPVVGKDELKLMKTIKNIVRKGRVTSIDLEGETVRLFFDGKGRDGQDPVWSIPPSEDETIFVHCTSPGPFNGTEIEELFISKKEMRLFMLFAPPVSISPSVQARLEAARKKGGLDLEFGAELLRAGSILVNGDIPSDNDVLLHLIQAFQLDGEVPGIVKGMIRSLSTLAIFLAIVDKDPMVGYEWMKSNRLSFFSIPGFKSGIVDDLNKMIEDGEKLGFTDNEIRMFKLLSGKLEVLKDK